MLIIVIKIINTLLSPLSSLFFALSCIPDHFISEFHYNIKYNDYLFRIIRYVNVCVVVF